MTDRKNELEAVKENITAELEQLKTSFSEKENEVGYPVSFYFLIF